MSSRTTKILGNVLKSARERLFLTQEDVAKSVGISAETVSMIERGMRDAVLSKRIPRIAETLKLDPKEFVIPNGPAVERVGQILGDVGALSDDEQDQLATKLAELLPAIAGKIVKHAAKKAKREKT